MSVSEFGGKKVNTVTLPCCNTLLCQFLTMSRFAPNGRFVVTGMNFCTLKLFHHLAPSVTLCNKSLAEGAALCRAYTADAACILQNHTMCLWRQDVSKPENRSLCIFFVLCSINLTSSDQIFISLAVAIFEIFEM